MHHGKLVCITADHPGPFRRGWSDTFHDKTERYYDTADTKEDIFTIRYIQNAVQQAEETTPIVPLLPDGRITFCKSSLPQNSASSSSPKTKHQTPEQATPLKSQYAKN
jgi:hypothetical protein